MSICAFEVLGKWSGDRGKGEKLLPLAEKESDRAGQAILADARRIGKTGHVVVWRCGSVMCSVSCEQHRARGEEERETKQYGQSSKVG